MADIDPNEPCPCGSGKTFDLCHKPRMRQPLALADCTEAVKLAVIPKPPFKTASVMEHRGEGTIFIQGYEAKLRHDCGSCAAPLIVGLPPGRVSRLVLRCNACGSYNDTPSYPRG